MTQPAIGKDDERDETEADDRPLRWIDNQSCLTDYQILLGEQNVLLPELQPVERCGLPECCVLLARTHVLCPLLQLRLESTLATYGVRFHNLPVANLASPETAAPRT